MHGANDCVMRKANFFYKEKQTIALQKGKENFK